MHGWVVAPARKATKVAPSRYTIADMKVRRSRADMYCAGKVMRPESCAGSGTRGIGQSMWPNVPLAGRATNTAPARTRSWCRTPGQYACAPFPGGHGTGDSRIPGERWDAGRSRRASWSPLRADCRDCSGQQRDDNDDPEHAPTRHELPSTLLGSTMLAHGQGACPAVNRRWCRRSPGEGGRRGRSGARIPRSCARSCGAMRPCPGALRRSRDGRGHRATRA